MPAFPHVDEGAFVTPHRVSRVQIDGPEWSVLRRKEKPVSRRAEEIARGTVGGNPEASEFTDQGFLLVPRHGWIMKPKLWELPNVALTENAGDVGAMTTALRAPGVEFNTTYKQNIDLLGVPSDASRITAGAPVAVKRVPSGTTWESKLTADQAAFPGPDAINPELMMDRIMAGADTEPANRAWMFGFRASEHSLIPAPVLASFFFGGPADTVQVGSEGSQGGQWCLSFRGGGEAVLLELTPTTTAEIQAWTPRYWFQYSSNARVYDHWHIVQILPLGYKRILIRSPFGEAPSPEGGSEFGAYGKRRGIYAGMHLYEHLGSLAGHTFKTTITGPAGFRVDLRRDVRQEFFVYRLSPPDTDTLADLPFALSERVPAGSEMEMHRDTYTPNESSISTTLFTEDHLILSAGPNSSPELETFETESGVTTYHANFHFTSDGVESPALRGYDVTLDAHVEDVAADTVEGQFKSIELGGQGPDPTFENGSMHLVDTSDASARLGQRGKLPIKVVVADNTPGFGDEVVVFHGRSEKAVKSILPIENGQINSWDVLLGGQWGRIFDQTMMRNVTYYRDFDPALALDERGERQFPKVTSLITDLLKGYCGVDASQLDIPDLDLRLWPDDGEAYLFRVGDAPAEKALQLARAYLDYFLLFDENVGELDGAGLPRGMWRVLPEAHDPEGNLLYHFVLGPNGATDTPRLVHRPGAYQADTTFIRRGSYTTWVQRPEFNFILVLGIGPGLPEGGNSLLQAAMWNPRSYNRAGSGVAVADNTSPDYIGYEVGNVFRSTALRTQEAVSFMCRRLFDSLAYGRRWASWVSPLVFVNDINDTLPGTRRRRLRYGDGVTVDGDPAVIKDVQPFWHAETGGDRNMWARYEAVKDFQAEQFPHCTGS